MPVCCSCAVLYVGSRGAEPQREAAAEWREHQLVQGGSLAHHRTWVPMVHRKAPECTAGAEGVQGLVVTDFVGRREFGERQK